MQNIREGAVKSNPLTLSELADAKPRRGIGAPARAATHYDAIFRLLRERGHKGVLGSELYARPELYGRSPRNRVSELRRDGHLIEGKPQGSDWFYRLIRDSEGVAPHRDSSDCYTRATGRPRPSTLAEPSPEFVLTSPEYGR